MNDNTTIERRRITPDVSKIKRILCTLMVAASASLAQADDIGGYWKHIEAPAWIEIKLDEGRGLVVRNDKVPERAGREAIKDIALDTKEPDQWQGQVYAERLGEYRKARIILSGPDTMEFKVKVGLITRTIQWRRVSEVPKATAAAAAE